MALPDNFGNYAMRGMAEIGMPEPVAWWPQTPIWWVILMAVILAAVLVSKRAWMRHRQNQYRRDARVLLREWQHTGPWQDTVSQLPRLLRAVALHAYPREEITVLSGRQWLDFLEQRCPGAGLDGEVGKRLLEVAYVSPDKWTLDSEGARLLVQRCDVWIDRHRIDG